MSRYDPHQIQAEVAKWQDRNWPGNQHPAIKAAKFGEEAGEVLGAVVKYGEGRRSIEDVEAECGDAVIALFGVASMLGFDLWLATVNRWCEVSQRGPLSSDPDHHEETT